MVSEKGKVVNGAWKNFCPAFCCFLGMDFVEYAQENQMHDGCQTAYYTKRDGLPRGKCCAGDEKHYHLLTECGTISYQTITCSTRPGGCGAKRRMAMKCPYCGYQESKVVDSRPADEGSIRRRRSACGQSAALPPMKR